MPPLLDQRCALLPIGVRMHQALTSGPQPAEQAEAHLWPAHADLIGHHWTTQAATQVSIAAAVASQARQDPYGGFSDGEPTALGDLALGDVDPELGGAGVSKLSRQSIIAPIL